MSSEQLDQILQKATNDIIKADNLKGLEDVKVQYLGKRGILTEYLKQVGQLPVEERPLVGQKVNAIKQQIHQVLEQKLQALNASNIQQQLAAEKIDITLPGRKRGVGSLHPVTQTKQRISDIFTQAGFQTMDGPEIEDDYHNFTALNIPQTHPARAMQDTFYFGDGHLLRTHMSPVQIRTMRQTKPPLRIIAMGRVYRRDFDLTHTPMFHQVEGLLIDKQITFSDLKGILSQFLRTFFENENIGVRFRASYFPFTEPSAEVDISCQNCSAKGCRICKNTGWLEVLGCGLVHPNVLDNVGIHSNEYQGWAFGAGLDRLTMLRYGITDLRALFENDIRFLKQF